MDLRDFIGSPRIIKDRSYEFEIARDLSNNSETLIFTDLPDSPFRVVGNVINNRDDVYRALKTTRHDYFEDVQRYYDHPVEPAVVEDPLCQQNVCDLYDLPILSHFEKDAGRYITAGIVIVKDPEYGQNASIHRMLLHKDHRLGIRIVPRHLYEYFKRAEERGEDLEVAIAIGMHPALFYAASYSPPLGYNEFSFAGGIIGKAVEMARCRTVDLMVPAQSEFVLEGRLLCGERREEGPFADVTGTYDRIREEPLIEVSRVTHRDDALYHGLLPSRIEHRLFMGMPREPRIYRAVSHVAPVHQVCLTDGGKNWLHGAVSLRKGHHDVSAVIEKAFEGHPSMKHVVVVDDDIDIFDPEEIEFAVATRFQGHKDAYVFKDRRGSTLDPSTDEDGLTTKVGIDATMDPEKEADYEFARIP